MVRQSNSTTDLVKLQSYNSTPQDPSKAVDGYSDEQEIPY